MAGYCILSQKEKIAKFSCAGYNYVVLFHPETAQEVLKSQTLINKDWSYDHFKPWLGDCLIISSDEKWRKRRKLLTPAFHFRILQDFQHAFNKHSNILIEKLKKKETEIFDIKEMISPCAFDIISDTAMKLRLNTQTQKDNPYEKAVIKIMLSLIQWFFNPLYWFPPIFYFSSLRRKLKRNLEFIHQFDEKIIQIRKENLLMELQNGEDKNNYEINEKELGLKKRKCFLDLLLEYHIKDSSFTESDIREEVDLFMTAGNETITLSISWTLYFLGRHQDIQEKVFQEINDIFGDNINRPINTEELRKMKYLECVIKESIRLCPPIPYVIRKCSTKMRIGEYVIPANSSLMVFIYAIHHNPRVYENSEIFNPDRFLPENSKTRHPFAFIPFSAGLRNCIGQVFAMAEMKTILAHILRHFKVYSLDPRDKILVNTAVFFNPISPLRMTIKKRLTTH